MKRALVFSVLVLALSALVVAYLRRGGAASVPEGDVPGAEKSGEAGVVQKGADAAADAPGGAGESGGERENADSDVAAEPDADETQPDEGEPMSEEEKLAAEAERVIDAFDKLTDGWMEPSRKGVAMADVDAFTAAFRKIPRDRQDECIHRALNLIPDENVLLLAGVLMDKSQPKDLVETVFNDVLNRDEDVKKPILLQIFKDKTHPCWADVAWILDVTGELPDKKP